jgi:hypothetical protein|tara:strand:- start:92 stop:748 length:657 start_codon:yes stop_codon:yes gene_type:complete
MHFAVDKSKKPVSPYAPQWNYSLGLSKLDIDLISLRKTILKKEKSIKKLPISVSNNGSFTDGDTGLGKNSTTSRFQNYNVLSWNTPETNDLKRQIKLSIIQYNNHHDIKTPLDLWVTCWVNVMRFGQKIKTHIHCPEEYSYLSGHVNIHCENTSTVYINPYYTVNDIKCMKVKNKEGDITLFPSYIPHHTTRNYSLKPRITIAFDIHLKKYNQNYILL